MSDLNPVSISECARELGVHKSTISRQVAAGIIPNRGTADEPKVDVAEARRARERGLDRSKQRGEDAPLFSSASAIGERDDDDAGQPAADATPPKGGLDYQRARTAREGFQARLAQIELEEKLANLLDKGEVVDAFFTMASRLREMTDATRVDVAARFGDQVGNAVGEAFRKMLQAIAEDFERRFAQEPANAA
jgi:hypothetical protein